MFKFEPPFVPASDPEGLALVDEALIANVTQQGGKKRGTKKGPEGKTRRCQEP
jgi:hypothetical protein